MPNKRKRKPKKGSGSKASAFFKASRAWHQVAGKNYKLVFNDLTTAVGLMDMTSSATQVMKAQKNLSKASSFLAKARAANNVKNISKGTKWLSRAEKAVNNAKVATPKGSYVFRLDRAHRGHPYNHININPDMINVGKAAGDAKFVDPHLALPPGGLEAGTSIAQYGSKVLDFVNKWAVPVAVTIDLVRTGYSAKNDYSKGTTRNTVNTVANIAGSWAGGYGGAMGGAALGTAIFPGIGTIVGGICGAVGGGFGAAELGSAIVDKVGDKYEYDIKMKKCSVCGQEFKARVYLGEDKCDDCRQDSTEETGNKLPQKPRKLRFRNKKILAGKKFRNTELSETCKEPNDTELKKCIVCVMEFKALVHLNVDKCDECKKKDYTI